MKIKGFDKNLCCRGMQFEIGETYDTGAKDEELKLCSNTVFHYCDSLQKVHNYYSCSSKLQNRFCEIEVLGAEVTDNEKCGSNKIKIIREIAGDELDCLKGLSNGNTGLFNTGYGNTGNGNTGNKNTGDRNTGYGNTGYGNTGYGNTGNWNTGDRNTGHGNSCDNSNGIFCNQEDMNIRIFNQPSGMSLTEFRDSKYYYALSSEPLELTYWDYNEGKLKERRYKDACDIWWSKLTDENKEIIQQIPNFDPDIFFDITGIRVQK